jgi:hypothetical protein
MARQAFKAGTFEATLEDSGSFDVLFATRGHETWTSAATAALKKADRMAWDVTNRGLVMRRIAETIDRERQS